MRPRIHVVLTPEEQKCFTNWSRGVIMTVILVAVATLALPMLQRATTAPLDVVATQGR